MKAHKFTIIVLLGFATLVSFLLIPSEKEQALIFLKEARFNEAEKIYEALLIEEDFNRNYLIPLTQIYIGRGDKDKATQIHEQYLEKNSQDIEVWENLFGLYRETLKPYRLMNALEQVVSEFPDVKYYEELIGLYEELGIDDERYLVALQKIVDLDPARKEESEKLIFALARNGQVVAASRRLDTHVNRFNYSVSNTIAELRLRLLISSGRDRAAYSWARTWLSENKSLSMRYMALLYSKGKSGNINTAMVSSEITEFHGMPKWLIDMFMEHDWIGRDLDVLNKFIARLDENKLRHYPVVMADLAIKKNDRNAIDKWLAIAEKRNNLTLRQKADLVLVYLKVGRYSQALTLLSSFTKESDIPVDLIARSASHLVKTNYIKEAKAIFLTLIENNSESDNTTDNEKIVLYDAWLLLAAGSGDLESVSDWISRNEDAPNEKLNNLYYAAADRSHFKLAAFISRKLYSRTQNPDEAKLLIASLVGLKNKNEDEKSELITLLNNQSTVRNQSDDERRELAFQLLHQGEKQAALKQFMRLAKGQKPDGDDVKQLLFLWGGAPDEEGLNWLQARATEAPDSELIYWWRYLLNVGGNEKVLAMGNKLQRVLPFETEKLLLNAYFEEKDYSGLDKRLSVLAENTHNSNQLAFYAVYAGDVGLNEVEETLWKKLYDMKPTHSNALRELGIAAYGRGDFATADNYLSQYLKLTKGDWQTALYLGDIYNAFERHLEAQANYKKSLSFIDNKEGKNFFDQKTMNVTRAYLLSQLGKKTESIAAYEELITLYPDDTELIAQYSDFLINVGNLDRAKQLLAKMK